MVQIKSTLTFLLLTVCSQALWAQPAIKKQPESDQLASVNSVLWKITGNGLQQPSYVFASWHLLCRNEIIFKNKVKLAISQTEQLLIQNFITYLSADDYFERQAEDSRINRGIPIYKIDNRKQRKKLLKLIDKNLDLKIDHAKRVMPVVKRMTPLEVFFSSMHSFIKDCNRLGSFDDLLFDHFKKNNSPIGTVNDRKALLESLTASGIVSPESLTAYIEDIESQRALVKDMKFDYYRDESLSDLKKLYRIFLNNDFTEQAKIESNVLALNVQPWVEVMADWMSLKPTFISINASYLIGDDGVLAALRERGYKLEPIM